MIEVNLFDSTFPQQACSVALQTPRLMRYVRNAMDWHGITVFVDGEMYSPVVDDVESRYKIGWLHEARALHPENYTRMHEVICKFDAVMTHDAGLLHSATDYTQFPFIKTIRGGSWVLPEQWGMYPKSKNVAMILSDKTELEGHQLRHAIAQAGLPIDLYGPSYTPIGYDKSIAYRDYRFAVVVEACREDNFFSEHLIDALAYGCVPLYWGCPNIHEYFPFGLMPFTDLASIPFRPISLNWEGAYQFYAPGVKMAQDQARAYAITEDWQIEHCLRPYVEAL